MRYAFLLIIPGFLSACVSQQLNYTPPKTHQGVTTRTVDMSFRKIWGKLVEGLAKNDFTIDSVNKDSGLIVVSKKLNPPSSFADCGMWDGYFKNLRTNQSYLFSGADSANYVAKFGDTYAAVNKTATLNSKSNIFVKKLTTGKTSISVSSQFSLKFDMNTKAYVYPGWVYGQGTLTTEWTSQDRGKIDKGHTECVSNFSLENSILNIAN